MHLIIWFAIVFATGTYICGPIVDPDLWWHITVGRWIVGHGEVPTEEHWNLFALGEPWIAYSWLVEVVFSLVDTNFGDKGLFVLKSLLGVGLAGTLFYVYGRISKSWFKGGALGMVVTAACYNGFTLRPQSLVWILFCWVIYNGERIASEGINKKRLGAIAFCMALWANTQFTMLLGLIGLAFWLSPSLPRKQLLSVLGIAFLATLITPYFGTEWITLFSKASHPISFGLIAEFQPAHLLQYSTAFPLLLMMILLLCWHLRPSGLRIEHGLLGGGFLLAGLSIVKFLPMAVIVIGFLLAKLFGNTAEIERPFGNLSEAIEKLEKGFNWFLPGGVAFLFLVFGILNFIKVWRYPVSLEVIPVRHIDFFEEKGLSHPLLHGFGRGGYVMYRFSDSEGELKEKVIIDGRTNINPPKVWRKFEKAVRGTEGWEKYLELTDPKTILWKRGAPLVSILKATGDWCEVYETGEGNQGYKLFITSKEFRKRKDEFHSPNC